MALCEEQSPTTDGALDEAYERLHNYGPEFDGYLSNHGPMVVEVLDRYQLGSATGRWLDQYVRRLEEAPVPRRPDDGADWRETLGDPSRLADWLGRFAHELEEQSWRDVLTTWWPRLLPGSAASAAHPLIRTGHVVRALTRSETPQRVAELGQSLGYWAARWHEVTGARAPEGNLDVTAALERLPRLPDSSSGFEKRLAGLSDLDTWPEALAAGPMPAIPADVPAALDSLVDAAVTNYRWIGHASPVMLVHAATAPSALAAVLPELPEELWQVSYAAAWCVTATVTAVYAPDEKNRSAVVTPATAEEALERALRNGDAHTIKFTDVAALSHGRGCEEALAAAGLADQLLR